MRCLKLRCSNTCNIRTFFTKHRTYPMSQSSSAFFIFSKDIHISSYKFNDENMEELIEAEESLPSKNIIMDDYSGHFRNTLYPDSQDPLIYQFKSCDSLQDLYTTMSENEHVLTSSHYCQILLSLYDILHPNNCLAYGKTSTKLPKRFENEIPQPLSSLVLNILHAIQKDVKKLTPEELVCCLLYSKRLGVDFKHPSLQMILMQIDYLLLNQDADFFPISALSRLTITFDNQHELWTKLFLIKTLPLIYKHFDRCQSVDEFKALTISMLSTVHYLREEILVEYEALADEFVTKGLLTRDHQSMITKAVILLSYVYYKPSARYMTYRLLHLLQGQLDQMFLPHLLEVQKVILLQVEPRNTIVELDALKKSSLVFAQENDELSHFYVPLLHLPKDSKGSQFMKEFISKCDSVESLLNAQVHLTTAIPDVCKLFWNKVADLLKHLAPGEVHTLCRVCFKYMVFSYRMASYHHRQFEAVVLSLVAREMVAGTAVLQPRMFALLASFVLSADWRTGAVSLSSGVLSRLLAIMGQLDMHSCLWVSRGLGDRMQRTKDVHLLLQVDSAINERTRQVLETSDPGSIKTFNIILRSCINRKQSMESALIQELLKRWELLDWSRLTSRTLRNLVYNLHITSTLIPPVVERMVEYCLKNNIYVTADTMAKLLHLTYHLGYTPTHLDSLCALTADLAYRDRDLLKGLTLLQVALALSFFNHLPSSLVRAIFTVDFLERLDTEIKHCFAKERYPLRVRQTLMELNRSVCIDHPEADVPWFHSKFCEEQKALGQLEVVPKSLLFTDIYSTLVKLVGDPQCVGTRAFTPYGYTLDMQLNLDESLKPVPFKTTEKVAHKLAFLLYYGDSYTFLEQRLKGYHQMKQRHLEILGYRVISLSDSMWNAMFMAEPKVKSEYLRNVVWAS